MYFGRIWDTSEEYIEVFIAHLTVHFFFLIYTVGQRKKKLQEIDVIFHTQNEKVKFVYINLMLSVYRHTLLTKFRVAAKGNGIDRTSILWGKLTKYHVSKGGITSSFLITSGRIQKQKRHQNVC